MTGLGVISDVRYPRHGKLDDNAGVAFLKKIKKDRFDIPLLLISSESTNAEIKRAYRKLISENHPDKLASRGLPESMRPVAEERSRELNAAYDLLKDARNIK